MSALKGKVAIITGGGQGVGLGIAQAFAAAGANVAISGRDGAKLERAAEDLRKRGASVLTIPADASKRVDAQRVIAQCVEKFGRLDVLVNNAQSSMPGKLLEDIDDDTIALTLNSGLLATIYHMQAALPHMKKDGGSIINLGSREGIIGGIGFAIYAATKEAIRGLSRTAAREWGKYQIRVNVICPAALSPVADAYLKSHPVEAEQYRSMLALGYFGDCEKDIGPIALFLASDASHYVTGQTINGDGGQTML